MLEFGRLKFTKHIVALRITAAWNYSEALLATGRHVTKQSIRGVQVKGFFEIKLALLLLQPAKLNTG
jgi:hypothetical protein